MDVANQTSPDLPANETCGATWWGGRETGDGDHGHPPVPPIHWRFSKSGMDSMSTKTGMHLRGMSMKTVKPVSFSLK